MGHLVGTVIPHGFCKTCGRWRFRSREERRSWNAEKTYLTQISLTKEIKIRNSRAVSRGLHAFQTFQNNLYVLQQYSMVLKTLEDKTAFLYAVVEKEVLASVLAMNGICWFIGTVISVSWYYTWTFINIPPKRWCSLHCQAGVANAYIIAHY